MDFSLEYSPEQEAFAVEVRDWLTKNLPAEMRSFRDPDKMSRDQWLLRRDFARKLGQKGWLYPEFPPRYGGGGLDMARTYMLVSELAERTIGLPTICDAGGLLAPAILACGTEEQKDRFLPRILKGEAHTWQLFTEPEAGTDVANQQTNALRAVKEADHFVVNGQKTFVGGLYPPPDQFFLLTRSDLKAPRHKNISAFACPANLPGITIQALDLFTPSIFCNACRQDTGTLAGVKYSVFFDDVKLPGTYLIGGEGNGWKVTHATLELEHTGGHGKVLVKNYLAERFLEQCRTNPDVVARLKDNPLQLGNVANTYISFQIERLLSMRIAAGKAPAYAGSQLSLYTKRFGARLTEDMAAVLGPSTFVNGNELSLEEDLFEVAQRCGICQGPGGTPEALKMIITRALSIGI